MLNNFLQKNKTLVKVALIIYWLILITATSLPTQHMPGIAISDKLNHFLAYLILSVLLNLVFYLQERYNTLSEHSSIITLALVSAYGILDELHQMFIPGRSAEFLDWVADFSGSALGILIVYYLVIKSTKQITSRVKAK